MFANYEFAFRSGFLSGLFLVALGTGGIKPCVVSYGGDQFQEGQVGFRMSIYEIHMNILNLSDNTDK